jgi:hypothetical protein
MCKTVLIHESFAVGVRAHRFFEGLTRASAKPLEEETWNFDVLGIRDVRNAAASAAPQVRRSRYRRIRSKGSSRHGPGLARHVALATGR